MIVWKNDTIQDFVNYKIHHSQESERAARNYILEKHNNEHLDGLYKQLQKERAQLNHFKAELHKLNKIVFSDVVSSVDETESIDQRCEELKRKIKEERTESENKQKEDEKFKEEYLAETKKYKLLMENELSNHKNITKDTKREIERYRTVKNKELEKSLKVMQKKMEEYKLREKKLESVGEAHQSHRQNVEDVHFRNQQMEGQIEAVRAKISVTQEKNKTYQKYVIDSALKKIRTITKEIYQQLTEKNIISHSQGGKAEPEVAKFLNLREEADKNTSLLPVRIEKNIQRVQRFLDEKQSKYERVSVGQSAFNYDQQDVRPSSQSFIDYEVSEEELSRIEGNFSEENYEQYIESHEELQRLSESVTDIKDSGVIQSNITAVQNALRQLDEEEQELQKQERQIEGQEREVNNEITDMQNQVSKMSTEIAKKKQMIK